MAKPWAKDFYESPAWKHTRAAYAASVHWLCERCKKRGIIKRGAIVHHKKHLTPQNITDLEYLCFDCHNEEHFAKSKMREGYFFDSEGNLRHTTD